MNTQPSIASEDIEYTLDSAHSPLNKYTLLTNILRKRHKPIRRPSSCEIDYGYLREVIFNRKLLDDYQWNYFKHALFSKYTNAGYRNDYVDNLGFIIHAEPTFMSRYCRCGEHGKTCGKRFWCSRCAYAEATKLWKEYLIHFEENRFHFLTVSMLGDIPFSDRNAFDLTRLWKVISGHLQFSMKHTSNSVKGMLLSEEVSVRQFLPTRINPHVHSIIDSEDPDLFRQIATASIDNYLAEHVLGCHLHVSIKIKVIETQNAFKSALRYLTKPINLQQAYRMAWASKILNGYQPAWKLNSEVTDFIMGTSYVSHAPKQLHHIKRFGSMNAKHKDYLGTPTARRNDHWDEIKSISLSDDQWAQCEIS
jgi:hypothetical protein